MHPYDQAYGEMMRKMPESYKSRYGHVCKGTYSFLACGHVSTVQIQRHPGCYKCAEALPGLCQPAYPEQVPSNRRCAPCQAEADRQAQQQRGASGRY